MKSNQAISIKIKKGRFYEIGLKASDCLLHFNVIKLPNVQEFRQLDLPDPDLMSRQLDPDGPVYYCKFELEDRKTHFVANDLFSMLDKLSSCFAGTPDVAV